MLFHAWGRAWPGSTVGAAMHSIYRFLGFAIVITWFWYFYYRDETLVAQGMLWTAAWLVFREARQLLKEIASRPGRPSGRALREFDPPGEQ